MPVFLIFLSTDLDVSLYGQEEGEEGVMSMILVNASTVSEENFVINLDINSVPELCKSGNCSIEMIHKGIDYSGVTLPTPENQRINTGYVNIKIHDAANDGLSELEKDFEERWNIQFSCSIGGIEQDVAECSQDDILTNDVYINPETEGEDREGVILRGAIGTYDFNTDTIKILADIEDLEVNPY